MKPEGKERAALIGRELERARLDALVCTLPSEVLMMTGYWPVVGTAIAVANADGKIVVITPEDEEDLAKRGWAEVRTFSPHSLGRISTAAQSVVEPLGEVIEELGVESGRIGYAAGPASEPASYSAMNLYGGSIVSIARKAATAAELAGAQSVVSRLKAMKTDYEAGCVARSCQVAAHAYRECAPEIRPGLTEYDVATMFQRAMLAGGTDGERRRQAFVYCMSGPNAAEASGAYARSRARRIRAGDLVLVHCNSAVNGYWTDITRTYCMGEPRAKASKLYEAVFAAREQALDAIRPRRNASDVDEVARSVLSRYGFGKRFPHSTGHGVGFGAIDANAMPRLHPQSHDVLEPGMVFNVEPAVYIEGYGGIRQCEMVAVTKNGCELLTDFQDSVEALVLPERGRKLLVA